MKKVLIGVMLLGLLAGCGNEIKTYTREEKINLLEKAILEKESKSIKEYQEILQELKRKAEKGNTVAKQEYEEWKALENLTF